MARKLTLNGQALRRLAKPGSLSERIYGDLRARLQRCEIGPEDRLVDTEIAGSYGTSRMPVREALMRLANEGYLVGTTRGFVLPRLSAQDVADIFEVRRLLEPSAAASAAGNLDEAARRELGKAMEEARAALAEDDAERLILANARFRAAWLAAVANKRLAETIARFVDHVQFVRLGTLTDAPTRPVVARGLEGLYEAFMRGDGAAVGSQMAAFIAAAEEAFSRARRGEATAPPRRPDAAPPILPPPPASRGPPGTFPMIARPHPLKGPNRFKLGVFSANADGGLAITDVPERWRATLGRQPDGASASPTAPGSSSSCRSRAGAALAARTMCANGRSRPSPGPPALAAATEQIGLFMTVHVPIVHPLYAAKALATVDHISQGRAGLNIVCGWNPKEFAHVRHRRWARRATTRRPSGSRSSSAPMPSTEPFDFDGKYYHLRAS